MMSITTVSAGAASSGYYNAEGYYLAGSKEAEAVASWFGKGAAEYNLTGHIEEKTFSQILEGEPPNGQAPLGPMIDGERKHRAGADLTFSAPKSVSVAALVMGDERVVKAHDSAVKEALSYVETSLVQTRQYRFGSPEVMTGGKIIAGLFRHDTSRALDPQLHTHAVVANMVDPGNGRFTALHNDKIFRSQSLVTEIYSRALERGLGELGYDVGRDANGRVELRGIDKSVLDGFSKRRAQIEDALAKRGEDISPRSAELAALATRAAKHGDIDRDELHAAWRSEAAQLGFTQERMDALRADADRARDGIATKPQLTPKEGRAAALEATRKAIAHVSERQSVYAIQDVMASALRFAPDVSPRQVETALGSLIRSRDVLVVNRAEDRITDKETVALEASIIRMQASDRRSGGVALPAIRNEAGWLRRSGEQALQQRVSGSTLTPGQQEAVITSLTGKDRFVGVQGYAGTGKTTMLETVHREATRAGYDVEGLAPSNRAVAALREAVPETRTVQSVATAQRLHPTDVDNSKKVLVIDEASMVPSRDMATVMDYARRTNYARVILVGDAKQLDAIESGQPFHALQKAGMPTALMQDIVRQRESSELRSAVLHAIRGEVRAAFEKIGPNVQQTGDISPAIADRYLSLSAKDRAATGVVVLTNKAREEVNGMIRAGLRDEGQLHGKEVVRDTLQPLGLTRAETADARSWRPGDVAIALSSVKKDGLEKGHVYRVVGQDVERNTLTLRPETGGKSHEISLDPKSRTASKLTAYEVTQTPLAAGDQVRFRTNDPASKIQNGDRGTVVSVSEKETRVRLETGEVRRVSTDDLASRGLDHDYANTAHAYQGQTVDRIIVAMSHAERLADQTSFYVGISRARHGAELVTDDAGKLASRLQKETGERPEALTQFVEALRRGEIEKAREATTDRALDRTSRTEPDRRADADDQRSQPDHARAERAEARAAEEARMARAYEAKVAEAAERANASQAEIQERAARLEEFQKEIERDRGDFQR